MTQIQAIPITQLHENKSNPWHGRDDVTELAESIKQVGLLQPIVVRPNKKGFEIVCGNRRFRAAQLAGLEEVTAMVRELTDQQAVEARIVENAQREDVHPLEEALGFQELMRDHGYAAEDVAAKVGKSKGYVYGRLKLCALSAKAQKAFMAGEFDASKALLIARIPVEKLQDEILKDIKAVPGTAAEDEEYTTRGLANLIQRDYMLRLKDAPFDTADGALVPQAGPCTTCPKRTGAQPELFADVESEDVCTDKICFAGKRDAAWKIRTKEHKAAGQRVLTQQEAKDAFPSWSNRLHSNDYIDLSEKNYSDPKGRKWSTVLGKEKPPIVLARDQQGNVHELVDKKAAEKIAAANGIKRPTYEGYKPSAKEVKAKKEREAKDRIKHAWTKAAIAEIVDQAESDGTTHGADTLRMIAHAVLSRVSAKETCERRGIEFEKKDWESATRALRVEVSKMDEPQLIALLLEVACWIAVGDGFGDPDELGDEGEDEEGCVNVLKAAAELLHVDLASHRAAAEQAEQFDAIAKAEKAKVKAAKKKTKKAAEASA